MTSNNLCGKYLKAFDVRTVKCDFLLNGSECDYTLSCDDQVKLNKDGFNKVKS